MARLMNTTTNNTATGSTTKAKHRAGKVGAVVAAVASVAGMVFAASPATAAAYPTSSFYISDGQGSYYSGTLTWYNRSVGITGTFKSVGCRRVYGAAYANNLLDWDNSTTWCNTTRTQSINLDANVVGGATSARIWMTTGDPDVVLDYDECFRDNSYCA